MASSEPRPGDRAQNTDTSDSQPISRSVILNIHSEEFWNEPAPEPPLSLSSQAIDGLFEEILKRGSVSRNRPRQPSPPLLEVIGRYKIGPCVGTGGFGHVYRAIDTDTEHPVAIKIPREDRPAHFWSNQEIRAGQRVHHPNVVPVIDHGWQNDPPYLVTEFIEGQSLAAWLKQRDRENVLPFRAAASLVALLASGVHCCHESGVVHRDLKPANVLLQTNSPTAKGIEGLPERLVPRITDFGLSSEIDVDLESGVLNRAGTVAYMAPEQAEGRKGQGRAVDIHALGVILYELLTGALPYRGESQGEIVRKLLHSEPRSPRLLRSRLPRDLETICLKCLQKDPERRYANAADLEDDLNAFLESRPISARPISRLERTVRWARRRPTEATLVVTVMLATLALVCGTVYFIASLADQKRKLEWYASVGAVQQAEKMESESDLERGSQILQDLWKTLSPGLDLGFAFRVLWHRIDRRLSLIDTEVQNDLTDLLFLSKGDEQWLAISDYLGHRLTLWDPISRQRLAWINQVGLSFHSFQGDPTGLWFFSDVPGTSPQEKRLQHYDTKTLQIDRTFAFPSSGNGHPFVAPFLGNTLFVTSANEPRGEIRDATTFDRIASVSLDALPVATLASPDGQSVALMLRSDKSDGKMKAGEASLYLLKSVDNEYRLNRVAGSFLGFHDRRCLAFSPDGGQIAIVTDHKSTSGIVQLVELATGKTRLLAQAPGAGMVSFSPDGRLLAYGIKNGGIEVRNVATGELRQTLNTEAFFINGLAFSPDGQTLYTISDKDPRIWCWHLDAEGRLRPKENAPLPLSTSLPRELQNNFELFSGAVSPDSQSIALGGENGVLWMGPRASLRDGRLFRLGDNGITALRYFQNGQRLALASWDTSGNIPIINAKNGQIERVLSGHTNAVRTLDVSPNGRWLATGSKDGTARLWDLADPARPSRLIKQVDGGEHVRCVAFSPDGRYLAIGDNAGEQSVYDLTTYQKVYSKKGSQSVPTVAFSPKADMIAFGDDSGTITLVSWPEMQKRVLRAHSGTGGVLGLAFHPNGKELASCGDDGSVAVWDATSGGQLLRDKVLTGEVRSVAFSPDGTTLVAVDEKGRVSLLEAPELVDFGVKDLPDSGSARSSR